MTLRIAVNDFLKMEDIAFSDWPGQPVDLNSGNNPWLPAYGFQTPTALLEKEDFIGNPDAEYFLQGSAGHYMYLETILEETSDDLRSESDLDSRGSPVGWLATDSESGSVICIDTPDDLECDSDRELACPAKRRKQDLYLNLPNAEDDLNSLSRSSSLLQFETLEKQCQETCSSSPSLYSQYSFDSLEASNRKSNLSPDSLNSPRSEIAEEESDFYKSLKIDIPRMKEKSNDSLLYNTARYSGSDSSDSDVTLEASRSYDNLKTWRSFDSLPISNNRGVKEKASVENLSEDSGYSDHLTKSSSANNLKEKSDVKLKSMRSCPEKKNSYVGFAAYDGDVFQNFSGNFGVSYQDLTVFRDDHLDVVKTSPLIDHFVKNKRQRQINDHTHSAVTDALNIDTRQECDRRSNFKPQSSTSEPNLLRTISRKPEPTTGAVVVSSVPKDLNFIGKFNRSGCCNTGADSVAVKDWNLADLRFENNELNCSANLENSLEAEEMSNYKREGSYTEAMSNRVDLSDDEHSLYNKKKPKLPKTPIVDFDKKVLKTISEQSLQSLVSSTQNLKMSSDKFSKLADEAFTSTPISATERRNVASTPNLASTSSQPDPIQSYFDEERRKSVQDIRRKGSIIKSSTSTSGISDAEDKTMTSVRSFTGSNCSKGVHFSPVVSEVNWRDDSVSTVTPDRESSYSFGSSSPERRPSPPKQIYKPKARLATPVRLTSSQPDLSDNDSCKREFVDSLKNLRQDYSKSQPDVSRIKRRGSQLIKKDKDGSIVKAYIDSDGIQYKHTHLDLGLGFGFANNSSSGGRPHSSDGYGGGGSDTSPQPQQQRPQSAFRPVSAMEAHDARREAGHAHTFKEKAKSGKLGGFFSRLASFRFSLKKGAEEKAKLKKKTGAKSDAKMVPQQRVATKDDYIYIPLKGPPTANTTTPRNNNAAAEPAKPQSLSSKPPLPKQPPRVVHASVKKDHTTQAPGAATPAAETRHRRRRTIDSAETQLPMEPMGLIETDLDTEVTVITSGANAKTRSLLNLGPEPRLALAPSEAGKAHGARPHKSMEFLLDKQNLKVVEPPENELQKGERVMSEHQLRVQRSLQKLTIPEWYKQSQIPREGFLLKKHSPREARWTGTGSKTTSLSSLGSNVQSPVILSPTPGNQPFVRWSTSKLNSTASSPCASTRSSFNARQPNGSISPSSVRSSFSYRQPYMGWRSQERLSRPRTPAERLASSLLSSQNSSHPQQPQESPEIQTSIKEVTSAIVHYVSGLRPEDTRDRSYESQETASQRSSSVSPRGSQKLCWLESSFVGTRPLDSPQTPVTLSESQSHNPVPPSSLRLDLQAHNDVTLLTTTGSTLKPSPSSTTLEDVLDSLLGLPSTGRAPSPSLQETVSANTSPCRQGQDDNLTEQFRRRSEGSEPASASVNASRRVSFNSSPVLRCRYSRCGRTALATTSEASSFKNCHNCSYTYCSRACRRAHWEKHRKTCLFSRIGTLCRQVIAAAKEQKDTLTHLSKVARRGYLSHGPGAVKCFYPNPEAAETFLSKGLQYLGELTYVRWQDLLPSEMGPQLYAELVKMCKNYNPDTKLVLYVSVCVISEAPASGAVKWERQLVSRCAKMRLSKNIQIPEKEPLENPETLILTSAPLKGDVDTIKKHREIAVENLQNHLRSRGVSLKQQHPEIHKQLVVYCEDESMKFIPVTVYPTDSVSGKSFMCILMLEANEESLKKVENAGVRVRTVDLMKNLLSE